MLLRVCYIFFFSFKLSPMSQTVAWYSQKWTPVHQERALIMELILYACKIKKNRNLFPSWKLIVIFTKILNHFCNIHHKFRNVTTTADPTTTTPEDTTTSPETGKFDQLVEHMSLFNYKKVLSLISILNNCKYYSII